MEEREKQQKIKEAEQTIKKTKKEIRAFKLKFATAIGYFRHSNILLNALVTVFISVLAGIVTIGLSNTAIPLIEGNYAHMIYLLMIFSVLELVTRYLFFIFFYKAIIRLKGVLLFPYNIIYLYLLEAYLDVEFKNFFTVFGFVLLFSLIRSGILYILDRLKGNFSNEVERWKRN